MKKFFTLITIVFVLGNTYAQVNIPVAPLSIVNGVINSKTYVVLDNSKYSEYNDVIKAAIEKNWTLNKVEYITLNEFEAKRKEKNVGFLMINQVSFDADNTHTLFDFLVLIAGGNYKSVNEMPLLSMVPLCYDGADTETWLHIIPIAVKFTQYHINTVKSNPNITSKNAVDFYMQKADNLNNKKLYIRKTDVESSIRTQSAFKNIYPYPFEFVDDDALEQIINSNDENTLILHIIAPIKESQTNKCIKMIISPNTAQIYYYDMHNIGKNKPAFLLENDLKKMVK